MGFNETLKVITDFIAELNKSEVNEQQKKLLNQLKKILKELKKQQKTAKIYLIIGVIASGVFGYFLKELIDFLASSK